MTAPRLWAKSCRRDQTPTPSHYLPGHLRDVHAAAVKVLEWTEADQLHALGLPEEYRDPLRRCVLLGAAIHDLGKANDHFQGMVTGSRDQPQGLRHEWVSLLILELPEVQQWLKPAVASDETLWCVVQWAVAGHHRCPMPGPVAGTGSRLRMLLDAEDFRQALQWLAETFSLGQPPRLAEKERRLAGGNTAFMQLKTWEQQAKRVWGRVQVDESMRRFTACVKSCLIACDVAGSALPQAVPEQEERAAWIDRALERRPTADRLTRIVDRRRGANELRPFQKAVGASRARVSLVRAGCGTGKTLAAYDWAALQHPGRRLYFCYPTTGTATEGYRDYLFAPGEDEDTDLFHGRAAVDLEAILAVEESQVEDSPGIGGDELVRIGSLDAWSTPIVSCTTDVVLGLIQNHRRGMYGWPALAGSAFVFDEIHSYDDRLFGALLRFLQALPGLPVLLMTASLPAARLQALQECLAECGEELPLIEGPRDLEELPRYHREDMAEADLVARVERELADGGKVLWVCNTVGRVMQAAARFRSIHPFIYHSRFRYEDRVARHREVVAAFRPENCASALAICSQVAEMSLDLSATLLVTDLAPVSALIQRLGRLNRWARSGERTRPFVVVRPESPLPYEQADLDEAEHWLSRLPLEELSQLALACTWAAGQEGGCAGRVKSAWLDGGPTTTIGELREASPGLTVVLERDVPALERGEKVMMQVALPMPPASRRVSWRTWKRFRHTLIAPEGTIDYDPLRGGEWR